MKPNLSKVLLLICIGLFSYAGFSQEYNTFDVRYQDNIKGDLTFIANNIVNRDDGTATGEPEDAYDLTGNSSTYNDWLDMQYIDVDSDPTTFSSSTATLTYPQADCNLIRYAGLYWSATYPSANAGDPVGTGRQSDFNQVKFMVPGGTYVDVVADEILFDGFTNASTQQNSPYACYADVTALVTPLTNPEGDYTVANVRSVVGSLSPGGGAAGGWTLIIVYENPNLTGKLITTFDGFARVRSANPSVDINYSGFNTIPSGPVNANIGVAALEGDNRITGDGMRIRANSSGSFTTISNTTNPSNNFFNSNITLDGVVTTNRTPNSINTLGYDTDIFLLSNPANSVIPNDETAATFRFTSSGDQYYPFFNSFNVEIIEPNIVLEKKVEDIAGNDITGLGVNLGQQLDYVLSFQNIGNDDGTNYTIRDVLPINVTLDELNITLPAGVTYTYDAPTRAVVFTIPDNLIEEGDPASAIRMRVQVASNCFDFVDACTDLIENLAYSTYEGVINDNQITDDPSVSDFDNCGFVTPGATNFLLDDLSTCGFDRTVELCGDTAVLDAGDNFDNYIWYRDENGNNLIDAGDTVLSDGDPDGDPSTLLVSEIGTYIVDKQVADPCKGFQEIINLVFFGTTQTNPITALINDTTNTVEGEVVICPNDGDELPKVFLCGLNDTELISINIPDATSIDWEQLDEASCTASVADCANKNASCTWNSVGTGNDFLASDAGEYRVVINYLNGCFTRFYFNIFKNPLDPQYNSTDLICTTPGNITVTNMPVDYEYQLLDATDSSVLVPYSANNGPSFTINSNGAYRVEMRQQGVVDGCVFVLDNIGILTRDFQVDVITQDADCNGLGEISISALNVEPQYYYEISQGGTSVDTFGPSSDNNYTFQNLNPGVYDVLLTTDDGCSYTEQVTINDNSDLDLQAVISQHITCREGNIQMQSTGGQTPHNYAIWSFVDDGGTTVISYPTVGDIPASAYQTSVIFDVLTPGDYTFVVVDRNNCSAISNTVTIVLEPSVDYTVVTTDESCLGASDGTVSYNIVTSNGYSVEYTLTYPDTSTATNSSGTFTGLPQGNYSVVLTQRKGSSVCDFTDTFTIGGPADAVTGTAALIQDYTCLQNGIIEAQGVTGGTPPYEYSIDGVNFVSGAGAETFSNLTDGTYNITIRDDNGCTFVTNAITLDPLNPPTDLTFAATVPNCPALTSDVTVSVIGGNTPFIYEITAPAASAVNNGNDPVFTGLAPGTYTYQVTDAKGCTYSEDHTIAPVSPINVVGQLISNITCLTDTDGEVLFTISGFNTSYDYSVTGPAAFNGVAETSTTIPLPNLDDGTYTITVTDNDTNCTDTANVTVAAPSAVLTLSASEIHPTCVSDGSVTLTSTGGWGGNDFSLTYPDGVTVVNNTTGAFAGLTQTGTYNATVTDANGCVVATNFDLDPAVAPVLQIVPNDTCYDAVVGLALTANVTSGGDGNYEYSLNGGVFGATNVFTGLAPGTHSIEVRDGKDCTDTATITIDPELTLVATAPNITACGTDTDITITAAGGDGSYVYAVVADGVAPVPGDFAVTNPITVTGAGDYDVYVRDNSGAAGFCQAAFDIAIVQDAPIAITPSAVPVICFGESNGSINIAVAGGNAPYQYSIDNGANYQLTGDFINLPAGTYPIRVRDANNCEQTTSIDVLEPAQLAAEAVQTQAYTCLQLGQITVGSVTPTSGGSGDYQYRINGSAWSAITTGGTVFTDLADGTYSIEVRDANATSCTLVLPDVVIAPLPTEPVPASSVTYNCDGSGNITILPNDPTYTYSIDAGAPQASNVFNNIAVGSHTVTIDYGSDCTVDTTVVVDPGNAFGANIDAFTDISCNGLADGDITISAENFDGATGFEYNINGGGFTTSLVSPVTRSGLTAQAYTIIVRDLRDTANCSVTLNQALTQPTPIVAAASITDPFTCNNTGATITASASGGTPAYQYQLEDNVGGVITAYQASAIFNNVGAGDYIIRARDNNLCSDPIDTAITVAAPSNPTFTVTETACYSGANDATIQVDVTSLPGNGGFQFSINSGPWMTPTPATATTYTFANLANGTYTIDVQDQFGCPATQQSVTIEPNLTITATAPNITACGTDTDITITAAGGDGSYVYAVVADGVAPVPGDFAVTNPITVTGAGDYDVYVRDNSGAAGFCQAAFDIAIVQDAPIAITPSAVPVICFGESNGSINIAVAGGNAPYQYSIDNGANYQLTGDFINLPAGTYPIRVRDANNCEQTTSIDVLEPAQLAAEAVQTQAYTCLQLGQITVGSVTPTSGGSGDYQYRINGSAWSAITTGGTVFTDLADGTYSIEVRDANATSCTLVLPDVVIAPLPTEPVPASSVTYNCDGSGNITILPNDPTYTYSIDAGAPQASNVFNNIAVGSHTVTIDYGSDCTVDTTVVVDPGNAFGANIDAFTDISCNGLADGDITISAENFDGATGFEYNINGGGFTTSLVSPVTLSGLTAQAYTIIVRDLRDTANCSVTLNQALTQPTPIVAAASITDPFTCNNTGATITASASGGTPAYQYQLEDNVGGVITAYQASAIFNNVGAGDYIIRARDNNLCSDPIDTAITVAAPSNPTFTVTETACYSGANDATIQVDVTSLPGNGGFQFSINSGPWMTPTPATATTYTFANLANGTYTIDVQDQFGCPATQQSVTINPQLTANALLNTDLTCLANASVTITPSGGSGSYSYEWSNDAGVNYFTTNFVANVFSTPTAGSYIFRVTDTTAPTACTVVTNTIVVNPADTPVITSITPTHVLCNGDSTGALDVVIDTSIGSPPYVIEVIETVSATNYGTQTTGLPAGDYEVTITDDKGCTSAVFPVSINQPDAITYGINLVPITCNPATGTDPGSITVENLLGGTAEYTYYLTGNNGHTDNYVTTAGGEDHTFAILEFGIYEVDVVDANGCSVRTTNIIASPPDDLDIDVSAITADCATGGTAVVTVTTAILGTNYEFGILDTFAVPYASTYFPPDVAGGPTHTFTGLTPGITYTFVVHDITTNCYYFETAAAPINTLSNMTATLDAVANITCTGAANGNVSFTFDNYDAGATDVTYEIFNAQSNLTTGFTGTASVNPPAGGVSISNFGTLPQGVYYILLTEVGGTHNGCSISTADFTIDESANLLTVTAASPTNDNCNLNAGVITATAQFGTAPYEFQYLLSTDPAPTAASAGWVSATTSNVESGDYIVYVKDANNCIQNDAITVNLDPSPEISLSIVDECAAEGTFEVLVTLDVAGITPYQLRVNGGAYQSITFNVSNEYTVSGLSSGAAQTIEIRDLNGCGETENFTIHPPLQFNATLTTLLDCEVATANNAEITIDVIAGSGTYEYSVAGPVNQVQTALPSDPFVWTLASLPGTYTVSVYDASTSVPYCLGSIDVVVPAAVTPIFTETHIDLSCNGANDGSISLFQTENGINPLTYTISPVAGTFNAATNTFENLPPNTYTVTATGTNSCTTDIAGIVIAEPNIINIPVVTVTEFACATGNNVDSAIISVDGTAVTGGSGSYVLYEFIDDQGTPATGDDVVVQSGPNTSYAETDLLGGTYIINVYDDMGCVGTTTATILPYDQLLTASAAITAAISCTPGTDGEITVTVTSTNSDPTRFEYSIDNGANYQASNVFAGLGVGTHNFLVRHVDTGCTISTSETITDPNTFTIDVVKLSDVICFGTNTGAVTFELVDATYPGGFDWEIFDTNGTPANLADDTSVATGNEATNGPTATINLAAGSYYVTITQTNHPFCPNTEAFTINGPSAAITANTQVTPVTCALNDGVIEVIDVLGGWGGYTYFVDLASNPAPTYPASYQASPSFSALAGGLAPGTDYQVWVADMNGCEFQLPDVTLVDPTPISASLQINQENCTNLEGEIEVIGTTGGQGSNYTYQLVRGGIDTGAPQTTTVFPGLGAGSYQVRVTDQWSCSFTTPATLLYDEIVPLATIVKPIDCTVTPGGEITITQTGGSGSFDYLVTFPDLVTTIANTTGVFTGLTQVGTYSFTITDQAVGHACSTTIDQELVDAVLPILSISAFTDVTCNGADDGTITVAAVDNGVGPYTFEIISGPGSSAAFPIAPTATTATTASFSGLEGVVGAGITYTIRATATNACTTDIAQVIVQPDPIANVNATVTEFACATGNNVDSAIISVDGTAVTGGSGSYVLYEFIDDQGTPATGDDVVVQSGPNTSYAETDLLGGTYIINVYDDMGCVGTTTATILPYDQLLTASAAITAAISCTPGTDGEITVTVTSTNSDPTRFEYSIDNGANYQASNVFAGLGVGTHNFLVRHVDTGCTISTSETITDPNTFTIDVVKLSDVICFGTNTGAVTFELVDATYPGGFDWEIFDTNGTPANLADDTSVATGNEATNGPTATINLAAGSYYVTITQTNHPFCPNTEAFTINGPSAAITANTQVTPVTCALNDGVIEVIDVLGGWGGYTYFVDLASNPAPTYPASYQASPSFSALAGGLAPGTDYQVWVADMNGCEFQLPDVTLVDPTPISASLQINQENCTNLEGEIEVIGTTGGQGSNYTYQLVRGGIDTGAPQTTTVFPGLGAGSYQVRVTDQWSCSFTTPATLLYDEIVPLATIVKPIDCTVTPGGEITVAASGGSANLDFTITFPDLVTTVSNATGVFTGLTQVGTYSFVVTDLDTASPVCTKTITQVLDAPTPVTFDPHTIVNVSCNGLSDGEITVNLAPAALGVNDNPVYTYNLYDALGTTLLAGPQTDPTFSGLSAAFYQVEAISSRSCSLRETVEVTEPTQLLIDASATAFDCNPDNSVNTSTITVNILDGATTPGVPSGTGPYLYSIDNVNFQVANTFEIIDDGTAQNITVYVTDANNCPASFAVPTIEPLNTFMATVSQDVAISCTGPEEVTITVADNGNPANSYTYELLPLGNPNGTEVPTALNTTTEFDLTAVGSYTFRVTDTTTGCYVDTAPYVIAPYDLIDVVATATTPVTCFGDTNGALEITVTDYAGAYTYEVFTDAGVTTGITGAGNTTTNPFPIAGLSGGNYFVRVTETANPLCVEDSNTITIVSPDTPLVAIVSEEANVTCTNDQGEILVDPNGGYAPYDIVLTNTTTAQVYNVSNVGSHVFTGLSAGNFTIAVTDNGGCVYNDAINLIQPTPITADITATPTTLVCFGDTNATVTAINVLNGEGVYQYQLNYYDAVGTTITFTSGAQSSPIFDNLGAGIYSITVSDGWSCGVETIQVTISEPTDVASSLIQTSPLTCTTHASLELSATGGTGPYQYSTDNVTFFPFSGGTTHTFNGIAAGDYQYYVQDAFGCSGLISNQITVDPILPLTITIDDSAAVINCTGEATATIIANVTGGLGNYSYELYGDAALTSLLAGPQTSDEFNGLTAGSYYVRVTSVDCETVSNEVLITDPAPLQIDRQEFTDVTCAGLNDGTITVEVSGGTGSILYAISPNLNQFDTENVFTDLAPGVYDVIAQDELGCFIPFQFTIVEPAPIDATFTALPEVCFGSADGSIDVTINGGTAPYRTSLNSNNDADFVLGQTSFTDLAAGTYVVFVRDAQDCETNLIITIDPGVNLNATVVPVYECDGDTPNNYVNITLEDDTVLGSVMYALDSTDPADMQLNPDFRDSTPGMHFIAISHANGCVNTVDFEILDFEPLTLTLEQNNINEITAVAAGGLEDYTFFFGDVDNGTDNTFIINRTDTYTVRLVDQNGCEVSGDIFIEFIDIEIPNFFTPDGDGLNDFWVPRNQEAFPEILTIIFDRYGREVYRMGLNDPGWDGMYHNTELPTGDYWYVIKLQGETDDREFIGHFTLYR